MYLAGSIQILGANDDPICQSGVTLPSKPLLSWCHSSGPLWRFAVIHLCAVWSVVPANMLTRRLTRQPGYNDGAQRLTEHMNQFIVYPDLK